MQELCTTPLSVGKLQKYGAKPFLGLMPCSSCPPPPGDQKINAWEKRGFYSARGGGEWNRSLQIPLI